MNSEQRIMDFNTFKRGWNGYNAEPISKEVIENALYLDRLIPFEAQVFPTAVDSIQFEFENEKHYLEVEVKKNGLDIFEIYENKGERKEEEKELTFDTKGIIEVLNHIKLFHKEKITDIALFSGAFNPPTKAHYHVMKKILKESPCNIVAVALCNEKFLKNKAERHNFSFYYSEEERLYMMLKMTALNKDIIIYGIEDGYTFDVLNNVKNRFETIDKEKLKNSTIHFIAGSDKVLQMKKWGHSKELLENFSFIILTRKDSEKAKKECEETYKNYTLIDTSIYQDISSTLVRNKITKNESISDLVTKDVEEAIEYLKETHPKKT